MCKTSQSLKQLVLPMFLLWVLRLFSSIRDPPFLEAQWMLQTQQVRPAPQILRTRWIC